MEIIVGDTVFFTEESRKKFEDGSLIENVSSLRHMVTNGFKITKIDRNSRDTSRDNLYFQYEHNGSTITTWLFRHRFTKGRKMLFDEDFLL